MDLTVSGRQHHLCPHSAPLLKSEGRWESRGVVACTRHRTESPPLGREWPHAVTSRWGQGRRWAAALITDSELVSPRVGPPNSRLPAPGASTEALAVGGRSGWPGVCGHCSRVDGMGVAQGHARLGPRDSGVDSEDSSLAPRLEAPSSPTALQERPAGEMPQGGKRDPKGRSVLRRTHNAACSVVSTSAPLCRLHLGGTRDKLE